MENIKIELTKSPKEKPTDELSLGFGKNLLTICLLWTMTLIRDGMMQE